MRKHRSSNTQHFVPVLGDFVPLPALWSDGGTTPIFSSEGSARWFIRSHREALVQAQAIAMHTGRILVHPTRFENVAQEVALRAAAGHHETR